jgi:hypothetical protein
MSESKFFYSYTDFVNERINFKKVDRVGINRYDSPAALYYKLVFYFTEDSGLLGLNGIYGGFSDDLAHYNELQKNKRRDRDSLKELQSARQSIQENLTTINKIKGINGAFYGVMNPEECDTQASDPTNIRYKDITKETLKNTAYNYLLLNAEYERAHLLGNFITLLSEINSSSPWYFQEITGLDTALERKMFSEGEFKIEDKPRQIAIKCLHDAYDNRIGTLLDLYRAACFSYTEKKEVVPANLRKFNMGVLVFNAPIRGKGGKSGIKENMIIIPDENKYQNYYIPSAKLIELRNCEIDYNSSKSAWGTLNTSTDPFSPEYTITINFDDCYESRYNEIMGSVVTDFINADINKPNIPNVKTIDDKSALGNDNKTTLGKQEIEKDYWIDSDYEKGGTDLYSEKMDYNSNTSNIKIGFNVGAAKETNVFATQWNNLKDWGKDLIQVPKFKNNKIEDDNIHDNGKVNMYGEFEYLNRLDGMGGLLGNVVQQATGGATNFVRKEAAKLYLGNIRSWSVSNAIEMGKRLLNGDIAGGIQDIERLSGKEGELVRPIGGKRNIGEGLPDGGFITKEIHDGGAVGRALNKGKVLDVDIINHTIGSEHELGEVHFTTENIQENTSKTPTPRKMPKRMNDPEGNTTDDGFVTSEIHDGGAVGRALNKGEVLDIDTLNHTIGTGNELSETHFTTSEIHDGGEIGRALNKGKVLDVDILNHTIGTENETAETHFTTKEIWHDPISRNLNKGTILDEDVINDTLGKGNKLNSNSWEGEITERQLTTKEIWPDPIQRNLYKGELLDEDVVNSTLGKGNRIDGKTAWTGETTEVYLRNKELYKDPTQRNIEGTPTQVEIWKDPFQRNIDSNITSELPGYIKGRTKFLNEMNTHQSLRNNI